MQLIPEQVSFLRKEIEKLKAETNNYNRYDYEKNDIDGSTIEDTMKSVKQEKLQRYQNLLITSEYVRKPSVDQIGIGTKFSVQFDDEEEIINYILVEERLTGNHMLEEVITAKSPIGKKILGKKEGESFPGGTIVAIEKNRKAYLSYIKDTMINHRKTDAIINESIMNSDDLDEDTKRRYQVLQEIPSITHTETPMITESQKELLLIEAERISAIIPSNYQEKAIVNHRLSQIKRILEKSSVANPTGDIISTGTVFSVMLFTNDRIITKRFQLIDKAVGDELENEYVEKISPIGVAVCGLKQQQEFIVRINNQNVSGLVFDISNDPNDIKTNDPLEYQKSKGSLGKI